MTPDRWKKLRAAIEAAVGVPPEQVDSVLSSVCGDDASLLVEARSMLRGADSARGFLESPPVLQTDRLSTGPPRERPPAGGPLVSPRSLVPDLHHEAAWRLKMIALVLVGIVVGAVALNNVLQSADLTSIPNVWFYNAIGVLIVAVSALVAWLAHRPRIAPARLVNVALAYEVLVAFGIALQDTVARDSVSRPLDEISWMCIWIVMFPLVMPASPVRVLVASLLAASTWPLAFMVGAWLGTPLPATRVMLLNFLEGYLAAGLALVPTLILRTLHAHVEKARHMGSYQLVEVLGQGGMGQVWKARHDMLARPAAIKLIRPQAVGLAHGASVGALIERFEREAQATAALHSPHTVELYDFGVTPNGTLYYVMELLDGIDLEQLVARFGPVPPERAVHFLLQMCDSLEDAHHAGLVHRDVKPANVYICRQGVKRDFVKLLDFGLVKPAWVTGTADPAITGAGGIAGTPAYLAPEMALGDQVVDGRADIYALGCVAYWLVTGQRVFEAASPLQVMMHHIETPPVAPSARVGRALPEDLEELILWCLQKRPDQRPADVAEVARQLAGCRLDARWTQQRALAWWDEHLGPASGDLPVARQGAS